MKRILSAITLALLAAGASAAEKTIFAHYMGCFPAGYGPIQNHMRNDTPRVRHDKGNMVDRIGGRFTNFALTPQDRDLSPEESAELEIRRAMRGGIDGFAIDAWAGGDGAKQVLGHLIRAAERMKVPFFLTICLDPACHPRGKVPGDLRKQITDTVRYLVKEHGKSPNLARRNGKILIFGYGSCDLYYPQEVRNLPEGPEKWKRCSDAYRELEKAVGVPLFLHYCFDREGLRNRRNPELLAACAGWAGKHFDAVGAFTGADWPEYRKLIADNVKQGKAEWSEPLLFQYNNKGGGLVTGKGLDLLRDRWESARNNQSTLIQFTTWNDYGEDTVLAPGYSTNYTILNVNRYFIDWWKLGRKPEIKEESIHLIFRRNANGSESYPFQQRRRTEGVLEVLTLLRKPGTVRVDRYGEFQAPAGMFYRQFPLKPGKVSAELLRGTGKQTVLKVTAPEQVSDKPFREDCSMVCFGSNFDKEWKRDFPNDKPLYYSEYGDLDSDGLPNWFEMYWFGKFPLMATATAADPAADPDRDGLTNLDEWKQQTNPLKPQHQYTAGTLWKLSDIHKRGNSLNPDRDAWDTPVWYYLYKQGTAGRIPHDGKYLLCPENNGQGMMGHFPPLASLRQYPQGRGELLRRSNPDGTRYESFSLRPQSLNIIAWESPVDGLVSVSGLLKSDSPGQGNIRFTVEKGTSLLFDGNYPPKKPIRDKIALKNIPVRKGERIFFLGGVNAYGGRIDLHDLEIALEPGTKGK